MSSTNSTLVVSNGHVDALIKYVLDVKPYHTKLSAVVERYIFQDAVNVNIKFDKQILAFLGADSIQSNPGGARNRRSNSWVKDIFSDGQRRAWPAPVTITNKFASQSNQERFVAGIDDQYAGNEQIKGINLGIFNPTRWDGPGITDVQRNGTHQQDSVDYFLSRGIHSFDIFIDEDYPADLVPGVISTGGRLWKQSDIAAINKFQMNPGAILYADVSRIFGTITDIKHRTTSVIYQEWNVTCVSVGASSISYEVTDSLGNIYGSFTGSVVGSTFEGIFGDIVDPDSASGKPVNFKLTAGFGGDPSGLPDTVVGDRFILTPFNKITIAPDAPAETWSLVKTNPSPFKLASHRPIFTPAVPRTDSPSLEVHTTSLDLDIETATWAVSFNGDGTYNVARTRISDGLHKVYNISLADGCSYKDENIHFTIKPGDKGFYGPDPSVGRIQGDVFNFTTSKPTHYKVFGSTSGWQEDATVGQWYWNGKIGFKIPKLEYAIKTSNSTIISSTTATNDSWNTIVSNNQVLRSVSYQNGVFFVAGDNQIVGASADGINWTSDISSLITPEPTKFLIVVGNNGAIGRSIDGAVWTNQTSNVTADLKEFAVVPDIEYNNMPVPTRAVEEDYVMVIGDSGTLVTSPNGINWQVRNSGTFRNLKGIAQSSSAVIIVGSQGSIRRSTDRINWVDVVSNTDQDLNKIIYDPIASAFIAVGASGVIVRSTDNGLTWFNLAAFSDSTFTGITYGAGKFVAITAEGWTASSLDGISWTRYFEKRLNAIAFGNGIFVGVGGQTADIDLFSSVYPVKSIAEPCVYTIRFASRDHATVHNNITGYLSSLTPNKNIRPAVIAVGAETSWQTPGSVWSDEWVTFHLDSIDNVFEYQQGDEIYVYLAPVKTYPIWAGYDAHAYDSSNSVVVPTNDGYQVNPDISERYSYDTGIAEITRPWLYNQEYFPLFHSYGAVIFPQITSGDSVIIDKATKESIRFKIKNSSALHPELGSVDDWLPLEFRYYDRLINGVPSSVAEFSDLTTYIEAYSGADATRKIFSIAQPRICKSDLNGSAVLTFDPVFFSEYMPFGTQYTLQFIPTQSYGQKIRVKITENFRTFARIRIDLMDIMSVNLIDADYRFIDIFANIDFVDAANIAFIEGGALPINAGYDEFPLDIFQYDERIHNGVISGVVEIAPGEYDYTGQPGDWIMPKPTNQPSIETTESTVEIAGTAFLEGLTIQEKVDGGVVRLSAFYDVNTVPGNGLLINTDASEYLISHNGSPTTPNLIVESLSNPGILGNPIPNMFPLLNAPLALSLQSFTFTLPVGFAAPFRLTIV